ncbi:Uncharacterised protein [Vibrio cholerae]|nr:Uncharacterised protein [Vibrio cholerae]
MRPIIGGSDMVIANTATKAKNSKREPSAHAATAAVPKLASNLVANIEESGGNSWLNIAGPMIWPSAVRLCEILRSCH